MGIPSAQAAQPISQQQGPQGKGAAQAGMPNSDANVLNIPEVQQTGPQIQVMPEFDSTTGGVPNQQAAHQTLSQTFGKGGQPAQPQQQPQQQQFGKGGGQPYVGQPNEFTMSGTTNSATSGQPRMGRRNPYSNTIQPWDNASIQTQTQSGKGKGH